MKNEVKGKAIQYRLLGLQEVEDPRISRQSSRDGKFVCPTHWPPLPHRKYLWYLFLL
jgi:hypothetical protein